MLREAFAVEGDPYEFVDRETATKLGGAMLLVSAAFAIVALAIVTPSGPLGWVGVAGFIGAALVTGARMVRTARALHPELLLGGVYVFLVGAIVYRASAGDGAPFEQLLFIAAIFAATIHPLRRTVLVLFCASAAACTPVWYEEPTQVFVARTVSALLLVFCVGLIVCGWMTRVRRQRAEAKAAAALARVDALTGLSNRRALEEALPMSVSFTRRHGQPLAMLVADMDDFKTINDTFGHQTGDDMLRGAARSMNAALRLSDPCFRWGGDEFVALLPDADLAEAVEIAERVRSTVAAACQTPDGTPLQITVGAAELGPGDTGEDLVARADAQLLERKAARRVGRAQASC